MSAPDFAAIIAHATFNVSLLTSTEAHRAALGGIAAKVPELCQTCAGESVIYDLRCDNCGGSASLPLGMTCENHHAKPQPCPDCPTIGDLLAIGAAVWTAPDANPNHAPVNHRGTDHHVWASGWDAALVHLRAVQS